MSHDYRNIESVYKFFWGEDVGVIWSVLKTDYDFSANYLSLLKKQLRWSKAIIYDIFDVWQYFFTCAFIIARYSAGNHFIGNVYYESKDQYSSTFAIFEK